MKKVLALVLAVMMLATVAFAANVVPGKKIKLERDSGELVKADGVTVSVKVSNKNEDTADAFPWLDLGDPDAAVQRRRMDWIGDALCGLRRVGGAGGAILSTPPQNARRYFRNGFGHCRYDRSHDPHESHFYRRIFEHSPPSGGGYADSGHHPF